MELDGSRLILIVSLNVAITANACLGDSRGHPRRNTGLQTGVLCSRSPGVRVATVCRFRRRHQVARKSIGDQDTGP